MRFISERRVPRAARAALVTLVVAAVVPLFVPHGLPTRRRGGPCRRRTVHSGRGVVTFSTTAGTSYLVSNATGGAPGGTSQRLPVTGSGFVVPAALTALVLVALGAVLTWRSRPLVGRPLSAGR